jgi:hypothetical protein
MGLRDALKVARIGVGLKLHKEETVEKLMISLGKALKGTLFVFVGVVSVALVNGQQDIVSQVAQQFSGNGLPFAQSIAEAIVSGAIIGLVNAFKHRKSPAPGTKIPEGSWRKTD